MLASNSTSATDLSSGFCAEVKEDSFVPIADIKAQESNQPTRNSHVNKGVLCNDGSSPKNKLNNTSKNERQQNENCVEESSFSEHSSNLSDTDFDKMLKDIEISDEKPIDSLKFRSSQNDDEIYSPSDIESECEIPLTPAAVEVNENNVEVENVNSVPEVSNEDQLKLSSVEKGVDDHANYSCMNANEDGLMDFHMFFENIIHWTRSEVFSKLFFPNFTYTC